ncbi:MAG TPA: hypothetical protein PLM79_10640 [Syntrophobacteraceae bacterium]|nr:hypothetical protein [Syntrophobacteraceae bacterium]
MGFPREAVGARQGEGNRLLLFEGSAVRMSPGIGVFVKSMTENVEWREFRP